MVNPKCHQFFQIGVTFQLNESLHSNNGMLSQEAALVSFELQMVTPVRSVRVCVIGGGVVGLATGVGFAKFGHRVVFRDVDSKRLKALRRSGFSAFSSPEKALEEAEVSIICVPTPTYNGKQDLSAVLSAVEEVVANVSTEHHLVIVKSTVLPGTTRKKIWPRLKRGAVAGRKVFGVVYNPEFLRHQNAADDFLNPPAIVVGSLDSETAREALQLYSALRCPKFVVSPETAELIKYAANAFNAMKVSFFNEMWLAARHVGVDPYLVSDIVPKVALGLRHPETWGNMGGRPFGGGCLPKDLEAFVNYLQEELSVEPGILSEVLKLNRNFVRLGR